MPNIAFYIIYTHAYQNGGKIRKNYIKKKPNICNELEPPTLQSLLHLWLDKNED